jgi:hypothetical protein
VETTPYAYGIFQQPWWLDAVAPGSWDAVTVEQGGQVVGRLPFVRKRRLGLTILTQPPLTPFLGPWLKPLSGRSATQFSQQEKIFEALIARLPYHDIFRQNFHHSITNFLPFFWAGFQQTTHYTYLLTDLHNLEDLWQRLETQHRRRIRNSENELIIRIDDDIDKLLHFNRTVFERKSVPIPYKPEVVRRIYEACKSRRAGIMHVAEDKNGRTHAVSFMVWDNLSAYGLLSGSDIALRSSGAGSRLVWERINYASRVTNCFDFEGSMNREIERFLRGFGGDRTAYFHVFRGRTLPGQIALMAHDLLHRRTVRRSSAPVTSSHAVGAQTLAARLTQLGAAARGLATRRIAGRG